MPTMMIGFKSRKSYLCLVLLVAACAEDAGLQPFASDGCSLFPDGSLFSDLDWCSCCFEHDIAYWRGGTADDRLVADRRLKTCIVEQTQRPWLASLMYSGVRVGGSPYVYSWFRWGYGWQYGRKYQALSEQEISMADKLFEDYSLDPPSKVCETINAPKALQSTSKN